MPAYPWVYSSSYSHDKLMLAASWLYRATGAWPGCLQALSAGCGQRPAASDGAGGKKGK